MTHLIGTGDNRWELVSFLLLTFDHGLEDGGMIGSQIDKDMTDATLG